MHGDHEYPVAAMLGAPKYSETMSSTETVYWAQQSVQLKPVYPAAVYDCVRPVVDTYSPIVVGQTEICEQSTVGYAEPYPAADPLWTVEPTMRLKQSAAVSVV